MSGLSTISRQNNKGSIPSEDYENYDYKSHHHTPFSSDQSSGTHNSIDAYCNEPQLEMQAFLGHGTASSEESERQHTKAMGELLATIDKKLMQ